MKTTIQIRAGAGGEDAKGLVKIQAEIYKKYLQRKNINVEESSKDGKLFLTFDGEDSIISDESGGHRWQRIPPSEKKGRVHTSTVTVAIIFDQPTRTYVNTASFKEERYKGGKGGQHQNKHANNVRLTDEITGLKVQVEGRHYHKNRKKANQLLIEKIKESLEAEKQQETFNSISSQVGSGMRGDKRRTYRERDNKVVDHKTNKKAKLAQIKEGSLELLQ